MNLFCHIFLADVNRIKVGPARQAQLDKTHVLNVVLLLLLILVVVVVVVVVFVGVIVVVAAGAVIADAAGCDVFWNSRLASTQATRKEGFWPWQSLFR